MSTSAPLLTVTDLSVAFPTEDGLVQAVDGVTLSLERGRTLAIVGESGSGKSVTSQAIMGLIDTSTAKVTGSILLDGTDIVGANDRTLRSLRGSRMAMIFQDPLSSLHPFYRIGAQLVEAVRVHQDVSNDQARKQAVDMLGRVGIPAPERRMDDYPHQLSGGMRQRVMIAMALINDPELLIADEPTTALDVTVQAQIMELIAGLQAELGTAVLLITHDLGVVAEVADSVAVMYGGRIVEKGSLDQIFSSPQMPYTLGLLASVPRLNQPVTARIDPIPGNPPSPIALPAGCVFQPRCTYDDRVPGHACESTRPALELTSQDGHEVRCLLTESQRTEIAAGVLARLSGVTS